MTFLIDRVLFTVKHSHKLFLTFMPILGKSGLEITKFTFSSQFDYVFLSKMTIKVSFFQKEFLGIYSTFFEFLSKWDENGNS